MIRIETETANDIMAREALLDRAMGTERVLKPSERLRAGRLPADGLALVAHDGDRLVGSVRLWNVGAGGRSRAPPRPARHRPGACRAAALAAG